MRFYGPKIAILTTFGVFLGCFRTIGIWATEKYVSAGQARTHNLVGEFLMLITIQNARRESKLRPRVVKKSNFSTRPPRELSWPDSYSQPCFGACLAHGCGRGGDREKSEILVGTMGAKGFDGVKMPMAMVLADSVRGFSFLQFWSVVGRSVWSGAWVRALPFRDFFGRHKEKWPDTGAT